MEPRSGCGSKSMHDRPYFFYGVLGHRIIRSLSIWFPGVFLQTETWKTWSNFKAQLARAFKEKRRSSRTLKTKGYAANVKSAQVNEALFTEIKQDHTMVLANIATTTKANRTLVALLTKKSRSSQRRSPPSPKSFWRSNQRTLASRNPDIVRPMKATPPIAIQTVTGIFMRRADKISNPTGIFHHTVLR